MQRTSSLVLLCEWRFILSCHAPRNQRPIRLPYPMASHTYNTPTPHSHTTSTHIFIIHTPHLYKVATNSEVPQATLSSTRSSSRLTTSSLAVQTRQREDEEEDDSGNWDHHSYMRIKRRKLQDQYLSLGQQDSTIFAGVTIFSDIDREDLILLGRVFQSLMEEGKNEFK